MASDGRTDKVTWLSLGTPPEGSPCGSGFGTSPPTALALGLLRARDSVFSFEWMMNEGLEETGGMSNLR